MADNKAPIIIKRKKAGGGGGHHGGAWKVAYADFVTAMMAFFLLMWLLNATTEKQRKGLADYFNPTIPINRISGGGEGAFGGDSVFSEDTVAQNGTGATNSRPTQELQAVGQSGTQSVQADAKPGLADKDLRKIEEALLGIGGESMVTDQMARHIVTRLTDEGLIVEFFDTEDEPLFEAGTAEPTPITAELAGMIARVFALVGNEVAINGHIRSLPEMLKQNPSWDLTTDRAQAIRELVEQAGLSDRRIQRVTGYADRKPSLRNPMAVRNNRIELILLRSDQ